MQAKTTVNAAQQNTVVLVRVSVAGKRHQSHSSSYKGKHLFGLEFEEMQSIVMGKV